MHKKAAGQPLLDPRTFLLLLVFANVITFYQSSLWIELGWIVFLDITMLLARRYGMAVKWVLSFLILLLLQYVLLPAAPEGIAAAFVILVNYSRRMFPCLMVGAFMLKEISLRSLILAMRKLHIPQKLIIPISVTIRYFPAIREETDYIRDAIKLRNIRTGDKLEALLVPLMVSATATAEELSAAAVTRGIENPVKKTSILELKFRFPDYACGCLGLLFSIGAFLIK
ncbi:energy-coupling factor transport system permease protein [Anaerocolumna jejuensis DSM 15929]|uniref:Energy-coupling factor transport system permease protein n=1 Tax=Anaerocolumna jejuensis DSM 15929 TaxID=1121322 RepID=A0A1M6W6W7_9FIRM|nr:energy-coupling factor transporter transmembrane component T [Anaerocolumna jejuensis]SHK89461.1 energy-coupling factor transport system permease protein [Anaerocolumna jejuensis DSM 15929]